MKVLIVGAVLLVALYFLLKRPKQAKKKVIISTDCALGISETTDVDDAFALLHLLNSPKIEVLLILVTYGNSTDVDRELKIVQKIVAGSKSPQTEVILGSAGPLAKDLKMDPVWIKTSAVSNTGLNRAAWLLSQNRDVNFLNLGPLTDCAGVLSILDISQGLTTMDKVTKSTPFHGLSFIYSLMGRRTATPFSVGTGIPGKESSPRLTDFNYRSDPAAAQFVMAHLITHILIPFEIAKKFLLPLDSLVIPGTLGESLRGDSYMWIKHWKETFGEDGFHPWDGVLAIAVSHPGLFSDTPVDPSFNTDSSDPKEPDKLLLTNNPVGKGSNLYLTTDVQESAVLSVLKTGY